LKLTQGQLDKIKLHFNLSKRELEVISMLFDYAESDKEIAVRMNIAERTAKLYIWNIYNKTGFRKKNILILKIIEFLYLQ
jgi:DNA-binding NarL/FixJ family response regulator